MNAVDYSLLGDTYLAVPLEQLRALLLFGCHLVVFEAEAPQPPTDIQGDDDLGTSKLNSVF
jgi:hypothetical protein